MSYGFRTRSPSGDVEINYTDNMAFVVAVGVVRFSATETGTKTVSNGEIVATDTAYLVSYADPVTPNPSTSHMITAALSAGSVAITKSTNLSSFGPVSMLVVVVRV